jgi:hypothetical protein
VSTHSYLSGFAGLLRRVADRIDHAGSPKAVGWSFTFEQGRGIVFREGHNMGCPLWYLGDDDHDLAYDRAEDRPVRVLWENLAAGRRPYTD